MPFPLPSAQPLVRAPSRSDVSRLIRADSSPVARPLSARPRKPNHEKVLRGRRPLPFDPARHAHAADGGRGRHDGQPVRHDDHPRGPPGKCLSRTPSACRSGKGASPRSSGPSCRLRRRGPRRSFSPARRKRPASSLCTAWARWLAIALQVAPPPSSGRSRFRRRA